MMDNRLNRQTTADKTKRMVGIAIFSAIIVVLQMVATFVKIGAFNLSLVLIPIVVGAAVYGPKAGAWLGGVFGFVVIITSIFGWEISGNIYWNANPFLFIIACLVRGVLAGYITGLVYSLFAKKFPYLGVVVSAVVCPVVNTGLFLVLMVTLFKSTLLKYLPGGGVLIFTLLGIVLVNFLIELAINVVLCPTVSRIIKIGKKM